MIIANATGTEIIKWMRASCKTSKCFFSLSGKRNRKIYLISCTLIPKKNKEIVQK